jgi:hypothetical protein
MTTRKRVHELKAGDLIKEHGAVFKVITDAAESQSHRPQAGHLQTAHGPCDTAWAVGVWVSGAIVPGYFGPGAEWVLQGNFLADSYLVVKPN